MFIDRHEIKQSAKQSMSSTKPSIYIVTLTYLLIIAVISHLYLALSGLNKVINLYSMIGKSSGFAHLFDTLSYPNFFEVVLMLALSIVSGILGVGYINYCLKVSRNTAAGTKDLFAGFDLFVKVFVLSILMDIFIFLWSLLFVIPGIIAAYRYRFAYYILFDNPEMSARDCLRESAPYYLRLQGADFRP